MENKYIERAEVKWLAVQLPQINETLYCKLLTMRKLCGFWEFIHNIQLLHISGFLSYKWASTLICHQQKQLCSILFMYEKMQNFNIEFNVIFWKKYFVSFTVLQKILEIGISISSSHFGESTIMPNIGVLPYIK